MDTCRSNYGEQKLVLVYWTNLPDTCFRKLSHWLKFGSPRFGWTLRCYLSKANIQEQTNLVFHTAFGPFKRWSKLYAFFYQPSNQFNSQALSVGVRVNLSISISNSFNHGFGKLLLVFIHKFPRTKRPTEMDISKTRVHPLVRNFTQITSGTCLPDFYSHQLNIVNFSFTEWKYCKVD